ncbi:MAG TPA: helix-turn-helix transcriptional regulator [Devosia sp.]|nr:helix-turn-helix transcriptional regulator [Devosia sp.]
MGRHKTSSDIAITHGSGDVFADLDIALSPDEALKLALARQITEAIVSRKLTQQQVSALAGVDQAKVSAITRGRIAGFSVERLMKLLLALGWNVEIKFAPSRENTGTVRVKKSGSRDGSIEHTRAA